MSSSSSIPESEQTPEPPTQTARLGLSWEIAVITITIVIILAVIATTIFQVRKKAQRKRHDAERPETATTHRGEKRISASPIRKPPTAHRSSDRSSSRYSKEQMVEHTKPARYYWDQR